MKYYGSPRWSAELADCSMPMTFDQYSNCGFRCAYCFSQYQRALGKQKEDYLGSVVHPVNVQRIKDMFSLKKETQFSPYIRARKVMQWGGLSDPFCPLEKEHGVGLELLRFFHEIEYPICFSTKGTWWLDDERYTELFQGSKNWNCKFSIITLDEDKAKKVEVGVDSPEARLDAIRKYSGLGAGGATLRLRPFIIGITSPRHVELIQRAGEAGATAMSTEFFCLETRSKVLKARLKWMGRLADIDLEALYKKYSHGAGYLRLNRNVKRQFIHEMRDAAKAAGMRFYVSDAHFKELCDNGSCCGLSEDWNYSRGQFCEALLLCKKNGSVRFSEISGDLEHFSKVPFYGADGFNTNSAEKRAEFYSHSLSDYVRWLWNNPRAGQAPYTMFGGVMKPVGNDDNGDVVYEYDRSRE